jgi:hypothetical protein
MTNPILKILESAVKPQPQSKDVNDFGDNNSNIKENSVSQEDYNQAKEAYKKLSSIEKLMEKVAKTEGINN